MVARYLLDIVFCDQINPAVANMRHIGKVSNDCNCRECRAAIRYFCDNVSIRFLNCCNHRFRNGYTFSIVVAVEHGQKDMVGDVRGNHTGGYGRCLLTVMMPTHSVCHDKKAKIGALMCTATRRDKGE